MATYNSNTRDLKTSEIPSHGAMIANLLAAYEMAKWDSVNFGIGECWYPMEHDNCVLAKADLLGSHGLRLSLRQMTDIVSIISPSRPWDKNIPDAKYTVIAWTLPMEERKSYILENHAGSRYGWAMYGKAWNLLDGNHKMDYRTGPKTFSFSDNLEFPSSSPLCVIDQHIGHIMLGEFFSPLESIGITYAQYQILLPPIYDASKYAGIDHRTFQSIIWQWRVAQTSKRKIKI